ncbi:MAG: DUF445 domain-containing protein [Desulfuromonadaceae bacterium]
MDNRNQILRRNKTIATGMMIGAAILFVIARTQKGFGAWEWVAAFAEAAMVGALADWFAVVALFKHPLGIPIPHTAIIKNKKDAIAGNLATFIRDKFLDTEAVLCKLREQNAAERLASYLISRNNTDGIATGLTRILSDSLGFISDDRVQNILGSVVKDRIENFDLSSATGTLLDTLRNDNRHQKVLDEMLNRFAVWLSTPEAQTGLAHSIDSMIKQDYPLLTVFIQNREQFSQGAGEKIARKINTYIQEVNDDPDHTLRQKFDTSVTDIIGRLKTDNVLREKIEAIKHEAVQNPLVFDYVNNLGNDLKSWLSNDLQQPHSKIHGNIVEMLSGIGTAMANNRELKESFNQYVEKLVITYADTVRTSIAGYITETVKTWETDEYVTEIELSIGSDLQFIRMNGTLVGGVIGLLLHAVSLLLK